MSYWSRLRQGNIANAPAYLIERALYYLGRPMCRWRESQIERKVAKDSGSAKVIVHNPFSPIKIQMASDASFVLRGKLEFHGWPARRDRILISVGSKGSLTIAGDFGLQPGSEIIVDEGGKLHIEGRRRETLCSMSVQSKIHVRRRVTIGADLLCAWDVFITDCDWHELVGSSNTEDTEIGDHVWISPRCSVLKGSKIGNGCILATGAVTHKATYPDRSLIGGIPARVLAKDRDWSSDMKPLPP